MPRPASIGHVRQWAEGLPGIVEVAANKEERRGGRRSSRESIRSAASIRVSMPLIGSMRPTNKTMRSSGVTPMAARQNPPAVGAERAPDRRQVGWCRLFRSVRSCAR